MRNFLNQNLKFIFVFIAGGILCGGVGIYAASLSFASGDVAHTKTDGTTTTVKNAINELYEKSDLKPTTVTIKTTAGSGTSGGYYYASGSIPSGGYKHVKLTNWSMCAGGGNNSYLSIGTIVNKEIDISNIDTIDYQIQGYDGKVSQFTLYFY